MKRFGFGRSFKSSTESSPSAGSQVQSGRSRTKFSSAGAVPKVTSWRGKRFSASASERAYGGGSGFAAGGWRRGGWGRATSAGKPEALKLSASDRAFGPSGCFAMLGKLAQGLGALADRGANSAQDTDQDPVAEAESILEVGDQSGRDDYDVRLAALAEAMEGRSEAEQLALIQEILRQDEGAGESWLQLDRLDQLRAGGTTWHPLPEVDPALLDAVEDNLMFTAVGMEQFIAGSATDHLEDFQDSSRDLRWFINNHGIAMTPAGLSSAIAEFRAGRSDEWNRDLDESEAQVLADGERILNVLSDPRMQSLTEEQRRALMETMVAPDNPAATAALSLALNQDGGVAPELLDGAMTFFAETGLREECPELATVVANARVHAVSRSLESVDTSDPESVATARAEIERLRDSDYAALAGIDPEQAGEMDAAVTALQGTLTPGAAASDVQQALEAFGSTADALNEGGATEALRLLALQSASVSLGGDESFAAQTLDMTGTAAEWVGLGADSTELLQSAGVLSGGGRFVGGLTGNVMGGLLVGISALDTLRALQDGDYAEAALGAAGTGVGIAALASSSLAAGAACAGLGLVLFAAGLGLQQWRVVKESNRYMTDEAQRFLEHSGLDPDIANTLTDQSGEGHSPVPFLFSYAAAHGLDRDQTVEWLNSLGSDDLDWIRDQAHHTLDSVNGDLSMLGGSADPETVAYLEDYAELTSADIIRDNHGSMFGGPMQQRFVVAGNWEEFDAMLNMIGVAPPRA